MQYFSEGYRPGDPRVRPAAEGRDGLRVAVRSAEAPPPLLAEADLIVDGPPGVLEFLQRLIA